MAGISIKQLVKQFGNNVVIPPLDLEIQDGELLVLVGPSGCGKTTLLRLIAGLELLSAGEMNIGETQINNVSPADRDIAFVFQDYALYPHMTVRQNMAFGLEMRKTPKDEIARRIEYASNVLQIAHLLDRKPKALSGGQRQRVAMGRAIVRQPKVFLFDEPLSNLDAKLRVEVRTEIRRLFTELKTTMVYVTHDQVEAMTLADRIVIMKGGVIQQIGTPREVFDHPRNLFVAGFIGSPSMNFLTLPVEKGGLRLPGDMGLLPLPEKLAKAAEPWHGKQLILGVRPEYFTYEGENSLPFPVNIVEILGADTLYFTAVGDQPCVVRLPHTIEAHIGETLPLSLKMELCHLFDPDTGMNLLAK